MNRSNKKVRTDNSASINSAQVDLKKTKRELENYQPKKVIKEKEQNNGQELVQESLLEFRFNTVC